MSGATTYGCLRYDIHAMFAARRRASVKVDSRGSMVDSVLIVGHAGTAAAVRGSARGSALRCDGRCCALPGGKRGSKLAAGADAELGEDLPQVVGDGGGADEQLRGDLAGWRRRRRPAGRSALLARSGSRASRGAFAGAPAGRPQLGPGPFGERSGAGRVEDLVRGAELVAGVTPAPLAAQPLAVEQVGAGQLHAQAGTAEAVDRLPVEASASSPSLTSARERASTPSAQSVPLARAVSGEPLRGRRPRARVPRCAPPPRSARRGPGGEPQRMRVLARLLRRGQRLLVPAEAVAQHRGRPLRRSSALRPRPGAPRRRWRPRSARAASASWPRKAARARAAYGAILLPVASATASASATSVAAAANSPPNRCTVARDAEGDGQHDERAGVTGEPDLAGGQHVPALVVPENARDMEASQSQRSPSSAADPCRGRRSAPGGAPAPPPGSPR